MKRVFHALCTLAAGSLAAAWACGRSATPPPPGTQVRPPPTARTGKAEQPTPRRAAEPRDSAAAKPPTRVSCEALAAKNMQCMEAFIESARDQMESRSKKEKSNLSSAAREKARAVREATLKKMAKEIKKIMTGPGFVKLCRKEMMKTTPKALRDIRKVTQCFMKSECREYVSCIVTAKP